MADPSIISLGPFKGVNNIDRRDSREFQPASQTKPALPFLREAINVDLDRTGWLRKRVGQTKVKSFANAHSGVYVGGMLLLVEGTELLRLDINTYEAEVVATGLTPGRLVSYCEYGSWVLWSNGVEKGRVGSFWGLEPPTLSAISVGAGVLLPGRYLVTVAGEALNGIESGVRTAIEVNCPVHSTISINAVQMEAHVEYLNFYVSDVDQRSCFWQGRIHRTQLPYAITQVGVSTELPEFMHCSPPPPGQIIRSYRGRVLVALENALYFSMPLAPDQFKLSTDFQLFPTRMVLVEPLAEGVFVGTEDGVTYWVEGSGPEDWKSRVVDRKKIVEGSGLKLAGRKIPALETAVDVVLWMTEDGPAVGLPSGQVQLLLQGTYATDPAERATLMYREIDGLRQLIINSSDVMESRFASSDRATCRVIKAGEG